MKYSKLLSKKKQYKYSANICFDLRNEDKIGDFIPNKTTTEILREYLGGIINNSSDTHSRILYGSYGTGKSHLLTVMSAVLGQINTDGQGFDTLVGRISKYDADLSQDMKRFVSKDKPYFVVPIYSDFSDFNKCISYSLKKELDRNGIEAPFKGFYDEALRLVEKWISTKEPHKKLIEECIKTGISEKELIAGLKTYDVKYEPLFKDIYEGMSFGAEFNSSSGSLLDNLNTTNDAIKEQYKGIVIVFDEFGRYIEDYGEDVKVKEIQELAEYCDHSGFLNYLVLVSHKQLSLYTSSMKRTISDEWKKVEGRFKATSINVKYDQCLSLIEYIIPKTTKWTNFKKKYDKQLNELYNQAWDFKGFLLPPETESKNPFEGGFPLHPITLYALDRLSKKVAQNERTFFTYLAGDEDYSLFSQLEKMDDAEFHFVGLDAIFDYFELNIKTYKTNGSYSIYKKLQYAISKLGSGAATIENKILKAMAVISIIADADVIMPDRKTLIDVIDDSAGNINAAIDSLEHKKIIKYMRQYGYYDFFDSSIFDLEGMIEEKIAGVSEEMVVSTLNEQFAEFAVYPYSYNELFHMNRVFVPVFAKGSSIDKKSFKNSLPQYYDGVVIFVLGNKKEDIDYATLNAPERAILLVNYNSDYIEREVRRLVAIQYYYSKRDELAEDDPSVVNELKLYLSEQASIVDELIRKWKSFTLPNINAFISGELYSINSEKELSDAASELMNNNFSRTIIINNDLLNKNELTGAIKLARKKALSYLIENQNMYSECVVLSPEYNILRAALSRTGISTDSTVPEDGITYLDKTVPSGTYVMKEIKLFLNKAEVGKAAISELYAKLKMVPYGLRDGYLPILVAFALREYENVSLYFHGKEHDYSGEELVNALENIEDYSIYICNWTVEQREYISALEGLFSNYLSKDDSHNRLKNLFKAINVHFSSISRSARTTELYVSSIAKQYRDILSLSHNDYNKFFFETLPQINSSLSELVLHIKQIIQEFDDVNKKQYVLAEGVIVNVLALPDKRNLAESISTLYKEKWKDKSHKAFDYITNEFLIYLKDIQGKTDEQIVFAIIKMFSGFELEYWSDSKINDFEDNLSNTINKLNDFKQVELNEDDIKVVIEAGTGDQVVSQFSQTQLSSTGQMLFNKLKMTVDNFGESLSYEEKISIVTQVLKDVIG